MHALEIGDFGLITCRHERIKPGFDEFADAAAQDGLFAKEIGFGFFGEGGFENAGARAAQALSVRKRESFGVAAGVLLDGNQRGGAAAFGEDFADAMAGRFRRNHGDVDILRRLDGAEANVEAVREHERLAFMEMRLNIIAVDLGLLGIGREYHDDVRPFGSLAGRHHSETLFFGSRARRATFVQAHANTNAAIPQVQRVSVALRAVADDGDLFGLDECEIRGVVVVEICHVFLLGRVTAGI